MNILEGLIPLTLFISIASAFIINRKFISEERLALIEKGANAKIFEYSRNQKLTIRYGLLLMGAGLGVLTGNYIYQVGVILSKEAALFSCTMMLGGLGLFLSYFIESALDKKKGNASIHL